MSSTLPVRGVPLDERTDTLETLVDPVTSLLDRAPSSFHEKDDTIKKPDSKPRLFEKCTQLEKCVQAPEQFLHWPTVIACTLIVSITQGWGFIFAVFQPWFKHHLLRAGMSESLVCLLPATQALAMMLTCSLSGRLADRFGHRRFIVVGCVAFITSTVGCSFGTEFQTMFITQFLQGFGSGLVYPPCLAIAVATWPARRQLVNSIMMVGVPVYAAFAAIVSRAILTRASHRVVLLSFTGFHAGIMIPSLAILCRAYSPKLKPAVIWIDKAVVKDRRFWCLVMSLATAAFAMLPPFVFLSVYTVDSIPLISPQLSIMPLALINISSAISRTVTPVVVDRIGARTTFVGALFLAAMSELIWAFVGTSYVRILAYACVNGAFGTTFLVVLPMLSGHLFPQADKTSLAGTLAVFCAPGCFFGPFIFDKVLHLTGWNWSRSAFCNLTFQLTAALFAVFV